VQYSHRYDKSAKKPVGHINMLNLTLHDCAEKHYGVDDPDNRK